MLYGTGHQHFEISEKECVEFNQKSEMPSSTRACEDTEFDDNQLESSEIEK